MQLLGAPDPNVLISMVQNLFTLTPNLNYTSKESQNENTRGCIL
jgi:hypothetical protein